jgi:PPOX class probable F420-dependent enzyme
MSIRLSPDEVQDFLESQHTGILTTIRSDGVPLALPVWFVPLDGRIHVRTPARSKKIARVMRDPRVCFTVESGRAWTELKSVVITGRATVLRDGPGWERAQEAIHAKYVGWGVPDDVPDGTARHYDTDSAIIAVQPDERVLSWDNGKIRRGDG